MLATKPVPEYLAEKLRSELKAGETLVWMGQPIANQYMKSGFVLWWFFVPWTAFSIFWIAGASGFHLPNIKDGWSLFPLFGLPFLLIGMGGLASPLWLRKKAINMVYAVTNQRAIEIISRRNKLSVKYYTASEITQLEKQEYKDGSGDLVFRSEAYVDSKGNRRTMSVGFYAIADVRLVQSYIEKLKVNTNL